MVTKRPFVGTLFINTNQVLLNSYQEHKQFFVLLHEVFHLLGFNDELWAYFRELNVNHSTTKIFNNLEHHVLTFATLIQTARDHYQCPTLDSLPLEDAGSSGSKNNHWEKTYLPNEFMNPTFEENPIISNISIAVLRATGWYTIKEGADQQYYWGRDAGCEYFKECGNY